MTALNNNTTPAWLPITAAAIALVVVHGFGRFVYTPLIPLLVADGVMDLSQAAVLASWNYVGYLLGALLALYLYQRGQGRIGLALMLVGNAVLTAVQLLSTQFEALIVLRLLNGISNGVVFVLAPALVLEWLVSHNKAHHSGLMYLGVGFGLLLSSSLVDATAMHLSAAGRWLPAALGALPLALWSARYLWQLSAHLPEQSATNKDDHSPLWDRASTPLFLAYLGAGLGYILPMTFLPAVAAEWQLQMKPSAWLVAALASIPSTIFWNQLGARIGDKPALMMNFAVQAIGCGAIVLLSGSELGLWLCALFVGGTFLGTVFLTQRLARTLHPHQGPRLSAALISLYSVTQLLGPIIARFGIEQGATLSSTFSWGAGAAAFGLLMMLFVPNKADHLA